MSKHPLTVGRKKLLTQPDSRRCLKPRGTNGWVTVGNNITDNPERNTKCKNAASENRDMCRKVQGDTNIDYSTEKTQC